VVASTKTFTVEEIKFMSNATNTDTLSFRDTWLALGIPDTDLRKAVDAGKIEAIKSIGPDCGDGENWAHWKFKKSDVLKLKAGQ
jgi:hypothetical protein